MRVKDMRDVRLELNLKVLETDDIIGYVKWLFNTMGNSYVRLQAVKEIKKKIK